VGKQFLRYKLLVHFTASMIVAFSLFSIFSISTASGEEKRNEASSEQPY